MPTIRVVRNNKWYMTPSFAVNYKITSTWSNLFAVFIPKVSANDNYTVFLLCEFSSVSSIWRFVKKMVFCE